MEDNFLNLDNGDRELVTEWLNNANFSNKSDAVEYLKKSQEILLHKSPHLLEDFLPSILNFSTSTNTDVKRALIAFIEEACKIDESLLTKVMMSLCMLLFDKAIVVQKRVVQAAISLYRKMFAIVCKVSAVSDEIERAWNQFTEIKQSISKLIDSDNDGLRTSVVKFLECVILLQSYPDPNEPNKGDVTLEDVPLTLKIARRRKLEEEANKNFDVLIKFNGLPHISSANLSVCIGALTNIAKSRPDYMGQVVVALLSLTYDLPPTLSTTQVNMVRKKLKTELCTLVKHQACQFYVEKITPVLLEFGCSQNEIAKLIPKYDDKRKYKKRSISPDLERASKKTKYDNLDLSQKQKKALEVNQKFIQENLTNTIACELVMKALMEIPAKMSPEFKTAYTETLKLGPVGEISILSKLLAELLVEAGVGPGASIIGKTTLIKEDVKKRPREDEDKDIDDERPAKKEKLKPPRIKNLKLNEITKPLEKPVKENLLLGAVTRLLNSDRNKNLAIRQKIITTVAASFNDGVRETILGHILQDIKNNLDLALSWLYEEYSIMQGFSRIPELRKFSRIDQSYNTLLSSFVAVSLTDSITLSRIFLEAPLITEQSLEQLKQICKDENYCSWAMGLLRDLIMRRPTRQLMFLNALLDNITYENIKVRERSIKHIVDLHKCIEIRANIEEFVKKCLEYLTLSSPPGELFGFLQGRANQVETWNEDTVKSCLEGYLALIPSNQSLIHDLCKVYIQTTPDVKRIMLRLLDTPIRAMGMDSAELLKLVQECPSGSETFVTRVIHILTDKGPPSTQLVKRVRELYSTRVSDIRFLIPVLNGLSKSEIINALPKLIKLNPVVVKEVFNRLLGAHGDSSISPTELLVSLHTLSTENVDIKTKMKAITMCLNEKQVFTQEVLAVVIQQLMEQTPLPTLLMRTVIQALGFYPRLSGFVMNILQRLIIKQVWKQKIAWEGFVKCCERTTPQSFSVLLQLPAPQLRDALGMSSTLKKPLTEHLAAFTDSQRAHVPAATQEIILGVNNNTHPPPPVPEMVPAPVEPLALDNEPLPPGME